MHSYLATHVDPRETGGTVCYKIHKPEACIFMHANATHHETTQTADRAFTDLRPPTQKCPGSQGAKLLRVSQSPRTPLMQKRLALKEMLREPWRGVWVEEGGGHRGKR